jgi:hypothetical protein
VIYNRALGVDMETTALSERVERLERQIKFWKLSVFVLFVLSATALTTRLFATTDRMDARIVAAQEFQILNASGKVVGRMNEDPGNPTGFSGGLVFMYENQQPAISMGIETTYGPHINLHDTDGRTRASVSFGPDGPAVDLFDKAQRPLIAMEIRDKGPRFKVFDKSLTKYIWTAP